jgi:4-amino-4-deoxy-L-arabinose transferase-like glycosyltransferase
VTRFANRRFLPVLGAIVALGAVVRFGYIYTDDRVIIGGDGFDYHFSAIRLADGLGYTSAVGDVSAPIAHHPPGWVTLLGGVSWLGFDSIRAHQIVGVVLGLGVIALAGLVGRRYFNATVGLIAALLAAAYPGFWVLEGNILSEPLGLFVLGLFLLAIAGLRDHPTLARSAGVGALCGLAALVRSEEFFLLFIVIAPVLLRARTLDVGRRVLALGIATAACFAVIAPWTVYNNTRFRDPVFLSTNDGGLLLIGNCPPNTYSGDRLGWYDASCNFRISKEHPDYDRSQTSALARREAVDNMLDNPDRVAVAVPARFGRLLAVFRPTQTVDLVTAWMTTSSKPIWLWVVSYWLLLPFAVWGIVVARRRRAFLLPLLGPVAIVVVNVAISYGEPRYHTMSDLGIIVLAAAALEELLRRFVKDEEVVEPELERFVSVEDETGGLEQRLNV